MPPNDGGAATGTATAGAGAAAASATTTTTATTGAAAAAATTHWSDSFQDAELKGYTQTKGWKDPAELANSYRQFEKLQGVPQERLLRLPEKADDPAWADINYKLGMPKDAKEYQFEVPKEFGDDEFATTAKDWFHKNGVSKKGAENIVKSWNEYVAGKMTADKARISVEATAQEANLKKEWGAAHDQNMELAKRAAHAFGFDAPTISKLQQAMGYDGVMKFMHSIQSKIGEDNFVSSSKSNNNFGNMLTPSQAKEQIAMKKKDIDFISRVTNKDSAALSEWTQLHKFAHPDQY